MPEVDQTIGKALDNVLDSVSTAMNNLADALVTLSARVTALENARETPPAPALPSPPEPTPEPTPTPAPVVHALNVVPPTTTFRSEEPTQLRSGAHIFVRPGVNAGSMPIINMNDVHIEIAGTVDSIWIAGSSRVRISGNGFIGQLTVSEWASGSAGHRSNNISIENVGFNTDRTAMDIQFAESVRVQSTVATRVQNYALWVSNCRNVIVSFNSFSTTGVESCVRLVDVTDATIANNNLASQSKHCFRVHGASSGILFVNNELTGPRGSMIATMPGDRVSDVDMTGNTFSGATVQMLGVPVANQAALQGFTFRDNRLTNGSLTTELAAYEGVPTWTIVR